jgi:hypothetical protein
MAQCCTCILQSRCQLLAAASCGGCLPRAALRPADDCHCLPGLQLLLYNDGGGGRLCRAALLPEVEEQAALPELLARVEPEAGAAELDLAADTAQAASSQLAARQGEALECVTQELLCNPEILR